MGPASLATPTNSISFMFVGVAHQGKQLSSVVTVILSAVVGSFSNTSLLSKNFSTLILKFHHGMRVFFFESRDTVAFIRLYSLLYMF